jgi:protease I
MSQSQVLIVTDDAGESFETLYALHRFREAGYKPIVAATEKKLLNAVIHDFYPGWNTYIEKPGYLVASDITFDEVNVDDYQAILLIGGRAPEFLRHNAKLIEIVQAFQRQEKWILSICHNTMDNSFLGCAYAQARSYSIRVAFRSFAQNLGN